jgi:hypothetical protein
VLYRGQKEALAEFLPLDAQNWITCGNALRLDWLSICPPTGTGVKLQADDLFSTPLDQVQIDFENEGGETYICGNPPYLGFTYQSAEQKKEIRDLLKGRTSSSGFLDYVAGWFIKVAEYQKTTNAVAAFVATNSICQGQSVSILWPVLFHAGCDILFAYTSFKWSNLASHKAGVTVVVVGIGSSISGPRRLYEHDEKDNVIVREGVSITPYLTLGSRTIVEKRDSPIGDLSVMEFGNKPSDGGHLLLRPEDLPSLNLDAVQRDKFIRCIYGANDFINGGGRLCIWIEHRDLQEAQAIESIRDRIDAVRRVRLASPDKGANALAKRAHQLKLMRIGAHMDVRELDIDLIDRINPFGEAYAILAKAMTEDSLKQVAAVIAAKRTSLTPEEAKELAVRAFRFKKERGRLPSLTSQDAWERRMAEGAAAFVRYKDEGRYE